MCGRFAFYSPAEATAALFNASGTVDLKPRYNIAPTQQIAVVRNRVDEPGRELAAIKWGLVPFWAKDPSIGNRMINARAETVAEKPAFRAAYRRRRCLVLADGFYEWKRVEGHKRKQPMYLTSIDGAPLAFAGVWDVWKDRNCLDEAGEPLELYSCTIITGEPNERVAEVHDRMPVMLPPDVWDTWLDRDNHDVDALQELLVPAPAELIQLRMVSTDVNNVRNNNPSLIDEAEPVTDD